MDHYQQYEKYSSGKHFYMPGYQKPLYVVTYSIYTIYTVLIVLEVTESYQNYFKNIET